MGEVSTRVVAAIAREVMIMSVEEGRLHCLTVDKRDGGTLSVGESLPAFSVHFLLLRFMTLYDALGRGGGACYPNV